MEILTCASQDIAIPLKKCPDTTVLGNPHLATLKFIIAFALLTTKNVYTVKKYNKKNPTRENYCKLD